MSIPASSPELSAIAEIVDPRIREQFVSDVVRYRALPRARLEGHVVLVGHRGAGKSRLLGPVARLMKRPAVDLDEAIAQHAGTTAREAFERSEPDFRRLERRTFTALDTPAVVSAGGGFLFHHFDLLHGHTAVLVPLSHETFRERMRADLSRPRLLPELTLDEEIEAVFEERDPLYRASAHTIPLALLVAAL